MYKEALQKILELCTETETSMELVKRIEKVADEALLKFDGGYCIICGKPTLTGGYCSYEKCDGFVSND